MLTTEHNRPPDWYSTKNCALQYAKLLERVDTPKRKRERSDSSNETPGEVVTKMLTKQRVDELTTLVVEEKSEYNKQKREIQELESGRLDHQLDALWEQLLKERAEEEEEERRYQQWLKEREEKITAIQQALKHQGPKVHIPPNKNKKNKPPWPATSSGVRRNSGMSETSSELDSAVDSPDVHESNENSGQEGGTQEPEPKPTPTSPLLSSLLSKSPILPSSSNSPLSQARGLRPGYSHVSLALHNLVTSAISGTDSVTKSTTSSASGSSTLSRLLDLPPSTPGGPLPRLSDLPTSSYEVKDSEKLTSPIKEDKESKSCGQDGKSSGCGSSGVNIGNITEIKEEKSSCRPSMEVVEKEDESEGGEKGGGVGGGGGEEKKGNCEVKEESKEEEDEILNEEKPSKNGSESLETDCKEEKFHQSFDDGINTDITKRDCENIENFVSSNVQSSGSDEKSLKAAKERDMKRREEKRKEQLKEKRLESLLKEESGSETMNRREDNSESRDKTDDDDDDRKAKVVKDSKLYKELESQSKKPDKSEKKDLDDYEQDNSESKDWMSEEDGNFQRSGKRKISGADYLGYSPQICESAPTSPASTHYGDDMESERSYKSWKKPIMILWNEIAAHRFASIFLRPITDEQAPGYHSVVYRPMDLQTIKRNIESGMIRNTAEFQRDMMLMFLNAIMYNTSDHNVHQMAHQMMQDTIATIESFLNTQMLARAEETPQKSLRRETRESSAKRSDDDVKRKRDHQDDKSTKKRR
ncbi:bromodomain-containing protein 8-like [Macrobrachium nipponense]|uniref:bromodomain-containing protein 8-like n=1 Tax=Macrobrachium nipponense TaxID=159736 RepID=UPI0030C87629